MNKKGILIVGLCAAALAGALSSVILRSDKEVVKEKNEAIEVAEQKQEPKVQETKPVSKPVIQVQQTQQHTDLCSSEEDHALPLSSIAAIAELPVNAKKVVENLIKDSEVFYIESDNDFVTIIKSANTENERFSRHDFEIKKVSLKDGSIEKNFKFPLKMSNNESEKEIWEYETIDEDILVPSSHTSLDEKGKIEIKENWYYNSDDSLKYKVTNNKNRTLSLRKTSSNNDGNWRDEHVFYDEKGNTLLNFSLMYEDNHLSRFTFYEADEPQNSVMVVNEYTDGEKSKETVYTSDYKVKSIYEASYVDGKRKDISIFDSEYNKIKSLTQN